VIYKAFISYSHSADQKLAAALQTSLQQFAKPYYAMRAFTVFRDQTDLSADPSLWTKIEGALDSSEFFLLLASPESAKSYWVKREINHWLQAHEGKPTHILLLLTRGQIDWDVLHREFDWSTTNALPKVLDWNSDDTAPRVMSGLFNEQPFYVDFRWASGKAELSLRDADFLDSVGTIAAELHGQPKSVLVGRDVAEHKRFRRLRLGGIVALAVLAVTATIFGTYAVLNARRATSEFEVARSQGLAAESYRYRDSNPPLAALLAIGANDVKPTVEALGAMLRVVYGQRRPQFIDTPATTALAVSPTLPIFATGHGDGTVQIRPISRGLPTILKGSSWEVSHLAFDSTGTYLAVAHKSPLSDEQSGDVLEAWNVAQGARVGKPITVLGQVSWMAILSDGRTAITLADTLGESLLRTWSLDTGQLIAGPKPVHGGVAALNPNGKVIGVVAAGEPYGSAETVLYFSALDLALVQTGLPLGAHASSATAATFDREGAWFITGHEKGEIRFSAVPGVSPVAKPVSKDDSPKKDVLTGHTGAVTSLAVHPDGKILASGSDDGTIRLWHLHARQPLVPPDKAVYTIGTGFDSFTGAMVDSGGFTSPDPHGEPILRSFEPQDTVYRRERSEMSVGFSPDGKYLLEASSTDAVQRWDLPVGRPVVNYSRAPGDADATDDASLFAKTDGSAADVQATDGSLVSKASLGESVRRVMLDQYGRTVALAGALSVQVFDARSGKPVSPVLSSGSVEAVAALSPDGARLSIAGTDEIIRFFDARSGVLSGKAGTGIPGKPSTLIFAADSRHLFVGTSTGAIHEVEVSSGEDLGSFQQGGDSVSAMAVDRSGRWLAAADIKNNVRIWDVHTRNRVGPVMSVDTTDWGILALRFSHDGTKLAIGTEERQVRLLDVHSGQQIGADFNTLQAAEAVAFTSDDGELRVFRRDLASRRFVLSAQLLRPIIAGVAGRNATWSEWERFFAPEPYHRVFAEYGVHQTYLDEARRRAVDGRTDDALTMFRRAANVQPDLHLDAAKVVDQIRLVAQGEDRARVGDTASAAANFKQAQALGWQPAEDIHRYANELAVQALTAEGVRFAETNEIDHATKLFSEALRAMDGHPSGAQDYDGRIQRELAVVGASNYAKQVALQMMLRVARDMAELGRVEDATEKLRAAGQYDPRYMADPVRQAKSMVITSLTKHGADLVARDDLDRARDLYARVHQIDPSFDADREFRRVLAGVKRGQVAEQAQSGRLESALKLIDEAQALEPQPPEEVSKAKTAAASVAHKAKGDQLAYQGQQQAAVAEYRAALAQNPSLKLVPAKEARDHWINTIRSQAGTLLSKGDRAGALKSLKSLLELDRSLSLDRELILLTCPSHDARDDLLDYFSKNKEKAFVLTPLGSWQYTWGYGTSDKAVSEAMKRARARYGGQEAFVYMRNDTVVAPNEELSTLRHMLRSSSEGRYAHANKGPTK
jgi:WD40 repeat protein/tetratricopeptide (TPR) repeat protein